MRWLNTFGFVDMKCIAKQWGVKEVTAYNRIKKLEDEGYIKHKTVLAGDKPAYYLTKEGVAVVSSELPPIKSIQPLTYKHDLNIIRLSQYLLKTHGGLFVTERQVRARAGKNGLNYGDRYPDGELRLHGKCYAIEVELCKKSNQRREKIFKSYLKKIEYTHVWYFCGSAEVKRQLEKFTKNYAFLKLFELDAIFNHQASLCIAS